MQRALFSLTLFSLLLLGGRIEAGTGRVVKVLPQFLDQKGRAALSPSLYERDAYQVILRDHPERRSGIAFFVEWKTKGAIWQPLRLQIELRGIAQGGMPRQLILDEPLENNGGWFTHWANVRLEGKAYKDFGAVTAWRATLWEGNKLLSEQKSFLW
jgi:hypothetical protein